jgi:hypothetical protein
MALLWVVELLFAMLFALLLALLLALLELVLATLAASASGARKHKTKAPIAHSAERRADLLLLPLSVIPVLPAALA